MSFIAVVKRARGTSNTDHSLRSIPEGANKVELPTERVEKNVLSLFICMSRGRRPGLQWKPSEVHNEEGEPIAGIGLFNGADAIETGEFIGFYTRRHR